MRGLSDLQKGILDCLKDGRGQTLIMVSDLLGELWEGEIKSKADYNQAHASLSRALTRLWQRGLVEIWKSLDRKTGVTLALPKD